ncbi:MAG TPA: enoyl-CoA hydratase-related protein, partial [Geobacterales bacterium]|nr:enoyl-CoA hydratase-related protein [Geobacterales bacterium]
MDASEPHNTYHDPALLIEERRGTACILTLNRSSARNSLSLDLIAALNDAIGRAGAMREAATIIITGVPPAFCSGHDLRELTAHRRDPDRGRAFFEQTMQSCSALMRSVVACHKPVIAAVNG